MKREDVNQTKKELEAFINGLTAKKQKSTGKKYFFDQDDFLVLDITTKSKLVYTHKSSFPMLKDFPDSEGADMVKEVLNKLGFESENVCFMDKSYPSERNMFDSYTSFSSSEKASLHYFYRTLKNRDNLVTIKK